MQNQTDFNNPPATPGSSGNGRSTENTSAEGTSGASTGAGISESAKQTVSKAKDTASQLLGQVKDQATSQVDQQRQTLASGMQAVAHAFQSMGEDLRQKEQGPVAEYAAEIGQAIAGQVEHLAGYLRERDLRQIVSETEGFARRSPAVFLGGAFVLGLAVSRFLKSSQSTSQASGSASDQNANTPGTQLALPPVPSPTSSADPDVRSQSPSSSTPSSQGEPGATPSEVADTQVGAREPMTRSATGY